MGVRKGMTDDNHIIDLFFERDESAITLTREKYGGRLRRISESILYSVEDAEECENDTYLSAWNTIPPKEPRTWFFAYLTSIIRNLSIDIYRKKQRNERRAEFVALTDELADSIHGAESPEDMMLAELERAKLKASIEIFLRKLDREKRALFIKRYYYFEETGEIAKELGRSESWVKTTLFRLRAKLKKELG